MEKIMSILTVLVVGVLVLSGFGVAAINNNKPTMDNHPPDSPEITGPSFVRPGTHEYTFKAIDPDGDDVSYYIDWGDTNAEETAFHASGEEVTRSHYYHDYGIVTLRVRAKDTHGAIGDWGTLPVYISQSRQQSSTSSISKSMMSVIPSTGNIVEDTPACSCILDTVDNSDGLLSSEHIAYAIGSFENCNGLLEWNLYTGNTSCICPGISTSYYGGTWMHTNGRIYATDYYGEIFELDPETCDTIYLGSSGTSELVDLSYDPYSDTLYGMSTKNLYTIDIDTGQATLIGCMGNPSLMISCDCDRYGNMHGIELGLGTGYFYSINTSTGHATQIGPTGVSMNYNGHMAYDKDYDTIYAIVFNYGTWLLEFHTINVTTGAMTLVGVFPPDRQFSVFTITYYYWNQPPTAPVITGETHGKVGVDYEYSFNSTDSDSHDLIYMVEWGDGDYEIVGPSSSGAPATATHNWSEEGTYIISARAKDVYGAIGERGYLEVEMPVNYQSSQQVSNKLSSQSVMSVIPSTGKIDVATSRTTIYNGSLSGYVNDTDMNPLEGARVRVYFHGTYEENYSDSSGYYHVTDIPICYCLKNATASKEGYKTEWALLSITENTTYDFVLTTLSCYPVFDGTMGENDWYVSDVIITFKGSGWESVYYKIDDGEWTLYTEPIVVSEDGLHTICWYYVDNEGNQSEVKCIDFKIDQTDPTIDLTIEKIGFRKWLFTAIVSDETSGVNRVEFYFDQELQGTVTEPPYEWTYGPITPTEFSVKGVILNPEFTEETVSFFAVIVRGHVRWHYIYGHPTAKAIVYDYAGNYAISLPISPLFVINHLYIFQQLTFQNNYSGYIGEHFINAVFEDGPL